MRNQVIYFDMDGVLADFVGGALKAHGKVLPTCDVRWNFWEQIGLTAAEFWDPLADPKFWAGLEPLADGMDLFESVRVAVDKDRIGILSSGLCPGSCDGKRDWLRKHLPGMEHHAIYCTTKHLCAAPCKVLIDDHEPNVDRFAAWGGRTVLVPRPWNRRGGETCESGRFDVKRVFQELVGVAA